MRIHTDIGTELLDLLESNPFFDFSILRWNSPNGWMIYGRRKHLSWLQKLFCRYSLAMMCPPYEIETKDLGMAAALTLSLNGTRFNVTLKRKCDR